VPKRKINFEVRRAIAAARLEYTTSEISDVSVEEEIIKEDEEIELRNFRHALSVQARELRSENRRIKRDAPRKINEFDQEDLEEKPLVIVSEHYFVPGDMVMDRRQRIIALVLETHDRIISKYRCGQTQKIAKCETLSVLVSGSVEKWSSKGLLPAEE
jgi:hypothetical protein